MSYEKEDWKISIILECLESNAISKEKMVELKILTPELIRAY
jgi:hypothetical protein